MSSGDLDALFRRLHGRIVLHIAEYRSLQIEFDSPWLTSDVHQVTSELRADPRVELVMPTYVMEPERLPDDPAWDDFWVQRFPSGNNWHLEFIRALSAWDVTTGGHGIPIGVLDFGFDTLHEDLVEQIRGGAGNPLALRYDHGTAVAGIIGATGDNGIGLTGVDWNAALLVYALPEPVDPEQVALAIQQAVDAGARIINYSGGRWWKDRATGEWLAPPSGGPAREPNFTEQRFLDFIAESNAYWAPIVEANPDVLFVQSAGNDRVDVKFNGTFCSVDDPELRKRIVTVGALARDGTFAVAYSNHGDTVDLVAPGELFNTLQPDSGYGDVVDAHAGGGTRSTASGQCFGRAPDKGAWSPISLTCTRGSANAGCAVGTACDDSNACSSGEAFSVTGVSQCACGGGSPLSGTPCGQGRVCDAGLCKNAPEGPPLILRKGSSPSFALLGTVVTPDTAFAGEVVVVGDTITCAAPSCVIPDDASIVQTNGIIFPGMIDTHNHVHFDVFDESDWSPPRRYTNHNQWTSEPRYKALVDAKQYMNHEGSTVDVGCELLKYGEIKALLSGTTSVFSGSARTSPCFSSLARTIDGAQNGLATDRVQGATVFPPTATLDRVCANFASGKTAAYFIHIAEGVDETARKEFAKLGTATTIPGCLYAKETTIVHGTALTQSDFDIMAQHRMGLTWSPRSNVFLYGLGTELTKTSDIPAALERGIMVALAPDWSIGGSQNLLEELRFAKKVGDSEWPGVLSSKLLVEMVTKNPAHLLGLSDVLGSIRVGLKADLLVVAGDKSDPYDALLAATPQDVRLVTVAGTFLYGDESLAGLAQTTPACDAISVCGGKKFLCAATTAGTTKNKLGQRYPQIVQRLSDELEKYDKKDLTTWNFAPLAPVATCPP